MKIASRIMIAAAATNLVIAPVAAEAGTRAGDNNSVYSQNTQALDLGDGNPLLLAKRKEFFFSALSIFAMISGIIFLIDSGIEGQSPGT